MILISLLGTNIRGNFKENETVGNAINFFTKVLKCDAKILFIYDDSNTQQNLKEALKNVDKPRLVVRHIICNDHF